MPSSDNKTLESADFPVSILKHPLPECKGNFHKGWGIGNETWLRAYKECQNKLYEFFEEIKEKQEIQSYLKKNMYKLLCPLRLSFDGSGMTSSFALGWNRSMHDLNGINQENYKNKLLDLQLYSPNCSGYFIKGWSSYCKESWQRAWYQYRIALFSLYHQLPLS